MSTPSLQNLRPCTSFRCTYFYRDFAGYFSKLSTLLSVEKSDENASGPMRNHRTGRFLEACATIRDNPAPELVQTVENHRQVLIPEDFAI